MKVIYGIGKIKKRIKKSVLAIGVFDGLHIGHQTLVKKAVDKANTIQGKSVVLTFWPHPVHVLRPEQSLPLIVSLRHRLKLLEKLGVALCVVVQFTKKFAKISPEKFVKDYLVKWFDVKEIFVGDDFRFGQNREGTIDLFKELGKKYHFYVHPVHPVKEGNGKIGSSQIRSLIEQGRLKKAAYLLGRPVSVLGKVVRGDGRGKSLGYPTANLSPVEEILPPRGVYAVRVEIKGKIYDGMSNIGYKPSFNTTKQVLSVEVYVFNFSRNIYGQEIEIKFISLMRREKTFLLVGQLIAQLKRDEIKARALLKTLP